MTPRRKARRTCRQCGRRVQYLFSRPRVNGAPPDRCRGCAMLAGWPVKYVRDRTV